MTAPQQNFPDNTLYELDNLDVLQGMNLETVDLIATDPPFNTKRNRSSTAGFYVDNWKWGDTGLLPDQWAWNEVHPKWLEDIQDRHVALYGVIQAARESHSDDLAAYLCFMAVRLLELHRVLKPTGSLYLHCDPTANAYLRLVLDAIFGSRQFRNEIIWKRTARGYKGSQFAPRNYNSNSDSILFYGKTADACFNMQPVLEPYDLDYVTRAFKLEDERGKYYLDVAHNRPSASPRPNLCYEYRGYFPPHPSGWKLGKARMEETDEAGDLVEQRGQLYRKIRPKAGRIRNNLWDDIPEAKGTERTGSPDQKPLKLYERMILASSNPGDLVLDPFAGCATTIIAAQQHDRRWVGIDRRTDARYHVVCRLAGITAEARKELEQRPDLAAWLDQRMAQYEAYYYTEPPQRTDTGETAPGLAHVYPVSRPATMRRQEMLNILTKQYGLACWGCGFEPPTIDFLQLDHILPASEGGEHDLENRALLCGPCNQRKSNTMTLTALRRENRRDRRWYGAHQSDQTVDIAQARAWAIHYRQRQEQIRII